VEVRLRMRVEPAGAVSEARATLASLPRVAPFERCLEQEATRLVLPAFPNGEAVSVLYPFVFAPTDAEVP
jgi:hypothetical protein